MAEEKLRQIGTKLMKMADSLMKNYENDSLMAEERKLVRELEACFVNSKKLARVCRY